LGQDGKDQKQWVSRVRLVGLLELQWRAPHHDWLVEFLNTYMIKGEITYAKMGKKIVAIDEHLIANVFKVKA
jgi:hypothetical protein